jgi:hypothetical protein
VDVRAVADLPRAGFAGGQPVAWRSTGVVVSGEFVDAEVMTASCLPGGAAPSPADRTGSACSAPAGAWSGDNLGHQFALTLKVPRWIDGGPIVDVTVESRHAVPRAGTAGGTADGASALLAATQPIGAVDAIAGLSMPLPLASAGGASRWQSVFVGATWYAAPGMRVEFVADRGMEVASARVDRTLTLKLVHAPGRGARIAAWVTRALDDRSSAVQAGAGIEFAF